MNKHELIKMFRDQLSRHDWYYMMSDDNRYYTAGIKQRDAIHKTMKNLAAFGVPQEEIDAIYNEYKPDA